MPSNIEIKAKVRNLSRLKELVEGLSDVSGEWIRQEDTFFHTSRGRLKLRVFSPTRGELIYYERADSSGPKPSKYSISKTDHPDALKDILASALGIQGVIRKKRLLYMVGQTRIHLDEVEDLGHFVELEVVLRPGQTVDEGAKIAAELMKKLEIVDEDLIKGSYLDLWMDSVA